MKKVISILMVAFAMTAMAACGDKNENSTDNGGGNNNGGQVVDPQDKSLEGTTWRYQMGSASDGYYSIYEVSFQTGSQYDIVGYHADGSVDNSLSDHYVGSYTYDGYYGSLTMKKASGGSSTYEGTFYVDEYDGVLKLIAEFRSERISFVKVQ